MTPAPIQAPRPRGPISQWVLHQLTGGDAGGPPSASGVDGCGDDVQLALFLAYEPHFSSFQGPDRAEWDTDLLAVRRQLEDAFATALAERIGWPQRTGAARPVTDVGAEIVALIDHDTGPSLSSYMEACGSLDQMRQFVTHRSAYQLLEGDAHSYAIPRLRGRAKQLLVEIQSGEYGADEPGRRMHSELFGETMRALGLDDRPNAYLDELGASSLAIGNLIALFGLNRRWRGALVGHLTVFETTSVTPMGRYSRALERMAAPLAARRFYDVHVLADAEHEHLALEMVRALAADEPQLVGDILFGARCALEVERAFAAGLLDAWATATSTSATSAAA